MKIEVGEQHIRHAMRLRGTSEYLAGYCCPIALAIAEALDEDRVTVSISDVSTSQGCFNLPTEAQLFIFSFDHQEPVEPFEFEFDGFNPTCKIHARKKNEN